MKSHVPSSKFQRSTKFEAPRRHGKALGVKYSTSSDAPWMLRESTAGNGERPYDLEERTARFGEAIVRFSKKIPRGPTNDRLIDQLVGCGTSVGGNYCEADESVSKRDFRFSISRSKKEAKETKFFLRMVVASEPQLANEARGLYREAKELHLIFSSIYRK